MNKQGFIREDILRTVSSSGRVRLPDLLFRSSADIGEVITAVKELTHDGKIAITGGDPDIQQMLTDVTALGDQQGAEAAFRYLKENFTRLSKTALEASPSVLRKRAAM